MNPRANGVAAGSAAGSTAGSAVGPASASVPSSGRPSRRSGRPSAETAAQLGRLLARALWGTAWWGVLLLAGAVLVAAVFGQARPLVPMALAVWLSYAVHELGHAVVAIGLGADVTNVRLVRRGAGLGVVAPPLSLNRTRVVAVGGPVAGILAGLLVVLALAAPMGLAAAQMVAPLVVVTIVHAVNLLPMAPDGRHLFAGDRIVDPALR